MKNEILKIKDLKTNNGQIEGLPKNPRFIKDERFEKLKKSIQDAPEMLEYRTLLVYKNVIICGNMRFRACKELGYNEIPCMILDDDTPPEKLREYAIKDNVAFGNDDYDLLVNEWDEKELEDWGVEWQGVETETENQNQKEDLSNKIEIEYKIEVSVTCEKEQEYLYNELTNKGYQCRILTL